MERGEMGREERERKRKGVDGKGEVEGSWRVLEGAELWEWKKGERRATPVFHFKVQPYVVTVEWMVSLHVVMCDRCSTCSYHQSEDKRGKTRLSEVNSRTCCGRRSTSGSFGSSGSYFSPMASEKSRRTARWRSFTYCSSWWVCPALRTGNQLAIGCEK